MTFEMLLAAVGLLGEVVELIGEGAAILQREITPEQAADLKAEMAAAERRWRDA